MCCVIGKRGLDVRYLKTIKNMQKKNVRFYQFVSENADESNKFLLPVGFPLFGSIKILHWEDV
jgi:hypothetical protein